MKIGAMCHMFHNAQFERFRSVLTTLPDETALHLTTCTTENVAALRRVFKRWPGTIDVVLVPNRGRDIAPKLVTLAHAHEAYDLVLHLHTKASMPEWREHLLSGLAGSRQQVEAIISKFAADPRLGMLGPDYWPPIRSWIEWGSNRKFADPLLRRMGVEPSSITELHFPAGSMFWARPDALKPIFDLRLSTDDFEPEPLGADGSTAHAVERLLFVACDKAGYRWRMLPRRPATESREMWPEDFEPTISSADIRQYQGSNLPQA